MTDGHSCKRLPVVQIYQRGRELQHSRNRPKWSEWQRGQFVPDLPRICFHCGQGCSFFHLISDYIVLISAFPFQYITCACSR